MERQADNFLRVDQLGETLTLGTLNSEFSREERQFVETRTNSPLCYPLTGGQRMNAENPKAVIQLASDDLFLGTAPSGNSITIDTDSARHSAPSPMELLLLALGSCTAVDVVSILRKKRQQVSDYRVEVRGQRREDHPRSYKLMEVHHVLTGTNISDRAVAQAIALSDEKYCSVAATLRPTAEIVSTFEILSEPPASAGGLYRNGKNRGKGQWVKGK